MIPAGRMQAAIPTTKTEIGKVANEAFGASMCPTMEPVAYTTTALAPASACATVRRITLPRCSRADRTGDAPGTCDDSVTGKIDLVDDGPQRLCALF